MSEPATIICALNSAERNERSMLELTLRADAGAFVCDPPVARFADPLNWIAVISDNSAQKSAFGISVDDAQAKVGVLDQSDYPGAFSAYVAAEPGAEARLRVAEPFNPDGVAVLTTPIPESLAGHMALETGESGRMREAVADLLLAAATKRDLNSILIALRPLLDTLDPMAAMDLLASSAHIVHKFGLNDAKAAIRQACVERWPNAQTKVQHAIALVQAGDYARAEQIAADAGEIESASVRQLHDKLIDELLGRRRIAEELRSIAARRKQTASATGSRIAYCLHNALPYMSGGYAMRSQGLASALKDLGHDVVAFVRPGFPSDSPLRALEPIAAHEFDGVEYRFDNSFGRRGRLYGYVADATDYYTEHFKAEGVGLVHAATNYHTALPAGIAAHRLGLPFVYEARSFWNLAREAQWPGSAGSREACRDHLLEGVTLALADRVVTLTDAMRAHIARCGVSTDDIDLAPNCVDALQWLPRPRDPAIAAAFGIGRDDIVIGYVGSMVGYEGVTTLVEAAAPLIRANHLVKLLIVGADPAKLTQPGTVEYALAARVASLGLGDRAIIEPRVARERVADVQALIDICAYPRLPLPVCELVSPLKPLEAMAMGQAVIASSVGGMRDMIRDGETGLVYAKGDTGALTAGLERLADDPALRASLGEAARVFVTSERTWPVTVAKVARSYETARERRRERSASADNNISALLDELFSDIRTTS